MDVQQLRMCKRAEPFIPFSIHLIDGGIIRIPTADYFMVPPGPTRTVIVAKSNGSVRLLNADTIVSLRFKTPKSLRPARRKTNRKSRAKRNA